VALAPPDVVAFLISRNFLLNSKTAPLYALLAVGPRCTKGAIKSELRGFHDDRAQYDGGAQDEPPEPKSTKTWQKAAWKQRLISVHDFGRTPEAQPFNPVPCRVHPHQADTHSGVKRRAEESDYYKSREHQTEHVRSVANFPKAEEKGIPRSPSKT
jgi:hypothetical protein